jgi:hypothetical protein
MGMRIAAIISQHREQEPSEESGGRKDILK